MKAVLVSCLLSMALTGFAQRQYYVLIESENRQQIYVRVGDNTYNSSAVGHVILSGLIDSTYRLEIGFPNDQFPSNQFNIKVNRKDHGYQLKNLSGKGWVLFNYQTADLVYPLKKEGMAQAGYSLVKKDDGFARLLSQVVNDTAVLYSMVYDKPVETLVRVEQKPKIDSPSVTKKETVQQPVTKKETVKEPVVPVVPVVVAKNETKEPTIKNETMKEPVDVSKQAASVVLVNKVAEVQSDSGKHMVFLDNKDSVKIFIGSDPVATKQNTPVVHKEPETEPIAKDSGKEKTKEPLKEVSETKVPKQENMVAVPAVSAGTVNQTTGNIKTEGMSDAQSKSTPKPVDTTAQQKKLVIVNSDCKAIAWDNDVDKIRVKMLGEKDVDDKINAARKIFKTKCFTAAQIKALTELFVTDQDKYKFLDAAYPFALDTENFKQLSYLLTDEYYIKRFKAMVRMD